MIDLDGASERDYPKSQIEYYSRLIYRGEIDHSVLAARNNDKIKHSYQSLTTQPHMDPSKTCSFHPLDMIGVVGDPRTSIKRDGNSEITDICGRFARLPQTTRQRHVYENLHGFYPLAYYVPMHTESIQLDELAGDAVLNEKLRHKDGYKDQDCGLLMDAEFKRNSFNRAEAIIYKDAEKRLENARIVLIGKEEEVTWFNNEVKSITPIKNREYLYRELSTILDPLPESEHKCITTHHLSLLRHLEPRRPLKLYRNAVESHPAMEAIKAAKDSMQTKGDNQTLWYLMRNHQGQYDYQVGPVGMHAVDKSRLVDRTDASAETEQHMPDALEHIRSVAVELSIDPPEQVSVIKNENIQISQHNRALEKSQARWNREFHVSKFGDPRYTRSGPTEFPKWREERITTDAAAQTDDISIADAMYEVANYQSTGWFEAAMKESIDNYL